MKTVSEVEFVLETKPVPEEKVSISNTAPKISSLVPSTYLERPANSQTAIEVFIGLPTDFEDGDNFESSLVCESDGCPANSFTFDQSLGIVTV